MNLRSSFLSFFRIFMGCLFGDKIRKMENFEEKLNLCVVWLEGGERKLLCRVHAFSTQAHKNFYFQNREKIGKKR